MNINNHILGLLKRIGLTDSEAKFYIASYNNPKFTIKDLQKRSGLSIASTYRAFERLHGMGLITSSRDSWRKNIEAVSIKTLAERISKEQRKLRKVELELKKLNDLMGLSSQSEVEEAVQIITDQNKIVEHCYKILSEPLNNFTAYGSTERLFDVIGQDYERDFVRNRIKKGKSAKAIITENGIYGEECIRKGDRELRDAILREDPNNQDYITYVYDDEVTIWYRDKTLGNRAIVIKDPAMVKIQRTNFETMWSNK